MIKHECEKCKYQIKNDECYCIECADELAQEQYTEGYNEAEKEFKKK